MHFAQPDHWPRLTRSKADRAIAMIEEARRERDRRLAEEEARRAALAPLPIEDRFRGLLWTWYVGHLTFSKRPRTPDVVERRMLERVVEQDGKRLHETRPYVSGQPIGEGCSVVSLRTMHAIRGTAQAGNPALQMTEMELEKKYGDGHYAKRLALLDGVLARPTAAGADLEAALEALARAKLDERDYLQTGYLIDKARYIYEERDVIAGALRGAVARAIKFYTRVGDALFDSPAGVPVSLSAETTGLLVRLAERLDLEHPDRDPMWTMLPPPLRRNRAGTRAKLARREEARNALLKAGLGSRDANDLLIAVGLAGWRRARPAQRKRLPCPWGDEQRWSTSAKDRYHVKCRRKRAAASSGMSRQALP